jgi:hypothetical protein
VIDLEDAQGAEHVLTAVSKRVKASPKDHVLVDAMAYSGLDHVLRQPGADTHPSGEAKERFCAELCAEPPGDLGSFVAGEPHREGIVEDPGRRLCAMQRSRDGDEHGCATRPARDDAQRIGDLRFCQLSKCLE